MLRQPIAGFDKNEDSCQRCPCTKASYDLHFPGPSKPHFGVLVQVKVESRSDGVRKLCIKHLDPGISRHIVSMTAMRFSIFNVTTGGLNISGLGLLVRY